MKSQILSNFINKISTMNTLISVYTVPVVKFMDD